MALKIAVPNKGRMSEKMLDLMKRAGLALLTRMTDAFVQEPKVRIIRYFPENKGYSEVYQQRNG
jgi:ATP phosphoribosyltransferase